MLDWYIRFRGIDEWPETTGTVRGTVFIPGDDTGEGKSPDRRRFQFTYSDGEGAVHQGEVVAPENADLFPLEPGDSFRVRYHPSDPKRNYVVAAHAESLFLEMFLSAFIAALIVALVGSLVHK